MGRKSKAERLRENEYHKQYIAHLSPEKKEQYKSTWQRWRDAHPEVVKAAQAKYHSTEKHKAYYKQYREEQMADPEIAARIRLRARLRVEARTFKIHNTLPPAETEEALLKMKGMWIRTHIRTLFAALDLVQKPEVYLKAIEKTGGRRWR